MPDRKYAPEIKGIKQLELPDTEKIILSNGIPMHVISMGKLEVSKLEVVFRAGRPFEQKQMVARATNTLLKEGSKNYTGAKIAEEMDFYGCSLKTPFNMDTSSLSLYAVNKHIDKILPFYQDLLHQPSFPQKELDSFIKRNHHRLQIDLAKSDAIAYRKITELIFGSSHPYGYNSIPETYSRLNRGDLFSHFHRLYNTGNATVFLSGKIDKDLINRIDDALSEAIPVGPQKEAIIPVIETIPEKVSIHHKDSLQTAIRLGRRLFRRKHQDYPGLYLLNMILGGYFGSRLMTNIREKQGYTYNIYSMIDPMMFDGSLYIGTEVSNETAKDTLNQIYFELDRLQTELVEEEEMNMLKNYTLGYLLTMMDGVFSIAELIKTMHLDGLPRSFIDDLSSTIKNMEADDLRVLAQRYLKAEDFWEVVVGANV